MCMLGNISKIKNKKPGFSGGSRKDEYKSTEAMNALWLNFSNYDL